MSYAFLEAHVDLAAALWTKNPEMETSLPRCPLAWQQFYWTLKPGAVWHILLAINELFSSGCAAMVTIAPNWDTWSCSDPAGMANWMWVAGNLEWLLDAAGLFTAGKLIRVVIYSVICLSSIILP